MGNWKIENGFLEVRTYTIETDSTCKSSVNTQRTPTVFV